MLTLTARCRALGGLLATYAALQGDPALAPPPTDRAAPVAATHYADTVLAAAVDLGRRLLPAFATKTGIPLSWVNLKTGAIPGDVQHTCVACATTLAPELRLLSHFSGDRRFGAAADRAVREVYSRRSAATGLVGNTLWTQSGAWQRSDAGVGAGADSYYEYLLKTYLIFGDAGYLDMFAAQFAAAQRGMAHAGAAGGHGWLYDVDKDSGRAVKQWLSSLSAFWPALQVRVLISGCRRSLPSGRLSRCACHSLAVVTLSRAPGAPSSSGSRRSLPSGPPCRCACCSLAVVALCLLARPPGARPVCPEG